MISERGCRDYFMRPDVGDTPALVQACAAAQMKQSCEDYYAGQPVPECAAVPGKRSVGAPCAAAGQCQTLLCRFAAGASCGTCSDRIPAGGDCTQAPAACERGAVCTLERAPVMGMPPPPAACRPLRKAGESCGFGVGGCDAGLSCPAGTCVAQGGPGAACGSMQPTCNVRQPLTCNRVTSRCEEFKPAVGIGQRCGLAQDGSATPCAEGASCTGTPLTCVADIAAGGACDTQSGPTCARGLACLQMACQMPAPRMCPM